MKYFVFDLQNERFSKIETEVRFNIAVARSGGGELVRFNITGEKGEELKTRYLNFVIRVLNAMKKSGSIQFYATESDFANMTMKAEFMYNKHAEYIDISENQGAFIYVKL